MADYLELSEITGELNWGDFSQKVLTACTIKAAAIVDSTTPSAEALDWARGALQSPHKAQEGIIWYAIASNSGLAISVILSASDGLIQTNVNDAVDALYP